MHHLRFRQVHLDFHTSPDIPGIGEHFDRRQWQQRLKQAHVDSITCFSLCHHGWSYHPTEVGAMHPHLKFNLLKEQFDACKELDINVPVYLSAGLNQRIAMLHPEWCETYAGGKGPDPLSAGFIKLCFNSPYLDYLCAMIEEAVGLFPKADGIFLDIINQGPCCCRYCMQGMLSAGLDPQNEEDRQAFARKSLLKYYERTTAAVRKFDPEMPVFHNSGHVTVGDTGILKNFSHLELESLPTGGWGYDHYPMSAAYSRNLGLDFLGMTGKFNTTWGEFGGIKHPNALRYECAAMIANGSKCSIGDQLHPAGELDESTYRIIGDAYAEVEEKEPWCDHVQSLAEIAILSCAAYSGDRSDPGDIGASRLLLEAHLPFDMVDGNMDFTRYKVLILPDAVRLSAELEAKLEAFLAAGGKLVMSGASGLRVTEDSFAFPMAVKDCGWSPWSPDFVKAAPELAPEYATTPFVMYHTSRRIRVGEGGHSLGMVFDPYFNRSFRHFCSHQQTPYKPEPSGFDAGVMTDRILYFAHPIFKIYRAYAMTALQEFFIAALGRFLGDEVQILSNLPSTARVTLMNQPSENRAVLHLLYANTLQRGGGPEELFNSPFKFPKGVEVIEELNSLYDVKISIKPPFPVKRLRLVPQGTEQEFEMVDGRIEFLLPELTCHQMVELS